MTIEEIRRELERREAKRDEIYARFIATGDKTIVAEAAEHAVVIVEMIRRLAIEGV